MRPHGVQLHLSFTAKATSFFSPSFEVGFQEVNGIEHTGMQPVLHDTPASVSGALARLGLSEEALLASVAQGYMARTNCTANHPPLFPSFVAWGETVRTLREQLAPMGWKRSDRKNYSRTLHPEGHLAIAVATGNEATGVSTQCPATKSAKGPNTIEAVETNRLQAWLPGLEPVEQIDDDYVQPAATWLLLIHHAVNEIRSELSQPVEIGVDGRINGWRERIMLPSIPLDPELATVVPPSQPDVDVQVRRKA